MLRRLGSEISGPVAKSGLQSTAHRLRLPGRVILGIVVVCATPTILRLIGLDLGSASYPSESINADSAHTYLAGSFTHALLEWTAVAAALFTAMLALLYSRMHRDVATGVIGLALLCAGTIDAYHTLAAVRLISGATESERLIPFTWALSRSFTAIVLIVGIGSFLVRRKSSWEGRIGYVILLGGVLGALACGAMYISTSSTALPQTIFPDSVVRRPWDVVPLLLFVFGAVVVFQPFHRREPSLFSHAVLVSVLLQVAAQLHMAFGSRSLFDHDFNSAHLLKVVAYLIPLIGLLLDYVRTYEDEAVARVRFEREATHLGRYRLLEKIGEGGMGSVYKAQHALLRRPTAIKLLPPDKAGADNLRRFEQEVQLTASLTHPHTITIFDYGHTSEGVFYYAMEYIDGLTLSDLVARSGAQHQGRVIDLMGQTASALVEAHGIGLVHRDIKPGNIMVHLLHPHGGAGDCVKVLDFGLVKEVQQDGSIEVTHEAGLVGTPQYMSPESIIAPNTVDARADLYALGAVAYYLLTGTHVFTGENVLEVCSHHLHSTPEPLSSRLGKPIAPEFEALVLDCLAKKPSQRPQSALEVERRVSQCHGIPEWAVEDARCWWDEYGDTSRPTPPPEDEGMLTVDVRLSSRTGRD